MRPVRKRRICAEIIAQARRADAKKRLPDFDGTIVATASLAAPHGGHRLSVQHMTDFTVDELICACIARQIPDGEIVAQGIATPLVMAGYLLAKCTHAPN